MDKRMLSIYVLMRSLGGYSNKTLEDRVFIQKTIYLSQLLGLEFLFRFAWHIRGPYSRNLNLFTYDINPNLPKLEEKSKNIKISPFANKIIGKLEQVLKQRPVSFKNKKSEWFELIASIHFLKHIASLNPDEVKKETVRQDLIMYGKQQFTQEQIDAAWKQLEFLKLDNIKRHPKANN